MFFPIFNSNAGKEVDFLYYVFTGGMGDKVAQLAQTRELPIFSVLLSGPQFMDSARILVPEQSLSMTVCIYFTCSQCSRKRFLRRQKDLTVLCKADKTRENDKRITELIGLHF